MADKEQLARAREKLKEMREKWRNLQPERVTPTPPRYDDEYFEALEVLDREWGAYSVSSARNYIVQLPVGECSRCTDDPQMEQGNQSLS